MPDTERLAALAAMLADNAERSSFVDYDQAEVLAERLAARLTAEVGDLGRFDLVPIPRGGLVVAGMLAYAAGISADSVRSVPDLADGAQPALLVDDMALTGARVREVLDASCRPSHVIALLVAPRGLAEALQARDDVDAVIVAHELTTEADRLSSDELEARMEVWQQQLGDQRLWIGRTDPIAFAWGEPDQLLWDDETQSLEQGWHLASPEHCLKNRAALGPPSEDRARRGVQFPERIAFGWFGDHGLVCELRHGRVLRLNRTAFEIWGALGTLGSPALVAAAIVERAGPEHASQIATDVEQLRKRFLEAGVLVRVVEPDRESPGDFAGRREV